MKIRFYNISETDFFDKILETLPVFYPKLLSVNVYAEDGIHNLPTHTEELFSKTVSFLKHIYLANGEAKLAIIENGSETDISLNYLEGFQEYETTEQEIDKVFNYLYPLEVISNNLFYYSYEASDEIEKPVFSSKTKKELHSVHIDDYLFNYNSRRYRRFFSFEKKSEKTYSYSYKTFLPEAIEQDHLVRLLLLSLSFQHTSFMYLKALKKSIAITLDKSEISSHKHILFSIPNLSINGTLSPVSKEITVEQYA